MNAMPRSASDPVPAPPESVRAALARLVDEIGDDRAVARIVSLWMEQLPDLVDRLRRAADTADGDALADTAHRLKSTCALLGATELRDRAVALETRGRDGAMVGAPDEVDAFAVSAFVLHASLGAHAPAQAAP